MSEVFREVREPLSGHLLFRFDPERDLVEIRQRGDLLLVDLAELRRQGRQGLDNQEEVVVVSTY
ncbi:MAG: hypothetical protein ACYC4L_04675 [Chloroflexota bacterium]